MIGNALEAIGDGIEWIAEAVVGFPDWSVVALDAVVGWLDGLSAASWVLLLFGLALLGYVWLSIRYAGMLGPVKVTLQGDGSTATGLSARLTDELMAKGLLPGPVPAGSPDATVVAAIAASPVPQATWLGKLFEVAQAWLPRPRNYEISGTLMSRGGEAGVPADGACGVTYTVTATARPSLVDANTLWAGTHVSALRELASVVYMKVSVSNPRVFPPWGRWWNRCAFDDYVAGVVAEPSSPDNNQATRASIGAAIARFDDARSEQPENWMPAIRAANLRETRAAIGLGQTQRQRYEAEALRQYLASIRDAKTLAEASYRGSVLCASLACLPETGYAPTVTPLLREALELADNASAGFISNELKWRALHESRRTRNLLRWWGVPLKAGRLRSRFEPRGRDRRRFLKAVKISRRCILQQIGWTLPWDETAVRLAFRLPWSRAGWQAHYNAACFFAPRGEWDPAVEHLKRSIGDPESGVTQFWLRWDPDLSRLRALADADFPGDETWSEIADRA